MSADGDGRFAIARILPQTKAAEKRIGVVARSAARRQHLQLLDIASAQDHVVSFECRNKPGDNIAHCVAPLILAKSLQSANADVVLVSAPPVGQMAELHWLDDAIDDKC